MPDEQNSIMNIALVGGGSQPLPGEISLHEAARDELVLDPPLQRGAAFPRPEVEVVEVSGDALQAPSELRAKLALVPVDLVQAALLVAGGIQGMGQAQPGGEEAGKGEDEGHLGQLRGLNTEPGEAQPAPPAAGRKSCPAASLTTGSSAMIPTSLARSL